MVYWSKSGEVEAGAQDMVLRQPDLFCLEKRRLRWDLTVTFSYLLVGHIKGGTGFFLQVHRGRVRTDGHNMRNL